MKLRLVAVEATCRKKLAAGDLFPSEDLRTLAETAGLRSSTLDGLRIEARKKLEEALAGNHA